MSYKYDAAERQERWAKAKPEVRLTTVGAKKASEKWRKIKMARFRAKITSWEKELYSQETTFNQIKTLTRKFGGLLNFCLALGVHPRMLLAWNIGSTEKQSRHWRSQFSHRYNSERSGLLPLSYLGKAIICARIYGVFLTASDIYPDLVQNGEIRITGDMQTWIKEIKKSQTMLELEDGLASLLSTPD